jgi:hypothetical protein
MRGADALGVISGDEGFAAVRSQLTCTSRSSAAECPQRGQQLRRLIWHGSKRRSAQKVIHGGGVHTQSTRVGEVPSV